MDDLTDERRRQMLKNDEASYFEIRALTESGYRDAIGGVCLHWALLELTVERVLSNIEDGSVELRYDAQLDKNLKRLSKLVENSNTLSSDQKAEVRELIQGVREISDERHPLYMASGARMKMESSIPDSPRYRANLIRQN